MRAIFYFAVKVCLIHTLVVPVQYRMSTSGRSIMGRWYRLAQTGNTQCHSVCNSDGCRYTTCRCCWLAHAGTEERLTLWLYAVNLSRACASRMSEYKTKQIRAIYVTDTACTAECRRKPGFHHNTTLSNVSISVRHQILQACVNCFIFSSQSLRRGTGKRNPILINYAT